MMIGVIELNHVLRWGLLLSGIGIILAMIIFAVRTERSVPQGVDLGFEIYYILTFLAGGLFIYLSTTVKKS
jgi:uncharacterized oligopeptide transporter (OPT) family protein